MFRYIQTRALINHMFLQLHRLKKPVTGINVITLHSAFHLPVKLGQKYYKYKTPNGETYVEKQIPVLKRFDNRRNIN